MVTGRTCSFSLIVAIFASVLSAAPVLAQEDYTPPEAVQFYAEARAHYAEGRYREASEALERALVLDPDSPTLVYNLARVYELLGNLERSLALYQRYQRLLPQQQAQEQAQADATIRRLEGARNSAPGEEAAPPPTEVAPLRQLPGIVLVRENGVADELFWIVLAGGAAALATGVSFGALALVESQSVDSFVLDGTNQPSERDDALARAQGYGIVTDVTLGLGGAALIVAGLLYFLREHTVERAPIRAGDDEGGAEESAGASLEFDLAPLASGGFVMARGRF